MPVNLYGSGDHFDLETAHVIPAIIRKCTEAMSRGEKKVVLWGTRSPTREFLYMEDCAEGILLAAEGYDRSDPVNLGSGMEITIRELAGIIAELTGFQGEFRWDTTKPNGQPRRRLDVSKAKKEFGFEAKVGLREGLQRTIEWCRGRRFEEKRGNNPGGESE